MTSDSTAAGQIGAHGADTWSGAHGADTWSAVAVLGDETRRRLLEFVRLARRPVTREEASAALGITRKLAAFHLDKLVAAGLLQARHGGHGPRRVGRAPKVYEPAARTVTLSLPARRHELLASLLAQAATAQRPQESARDASVRIARARGEALGAAAGDADLTGFLTSFGFEPAEEAPGRTALHNCPFHPVAAQAPQLVCAMNHAFLCGYLAASRQRKTVAVLAPRPGACCVELRTGAAAAAPEQEPAPAAAEQETADAEPPGTGAVCRRDTSA
ncbi:helix-turn-helix transcriptional regulator [Streptomyces mexicanus]|uniref:helix-turn-helix transcriptional regulator n=1 Tax=Streptomyces mexicanus TaxID=178566 RepID=UPI00364A32BD